MLQQGAAASDKSSDWTSKPGKVVYDDLWNAVIR